MESGISCPPGVPLSCPHVQPVSSRDPVRGADRRRPKGLAYTSLQQQLAAAYSSSLQQQLTAAAYSSSQHN